MLTKRKEILIILAGLLVILVIAILVTDAIGQERKRWAIPTYTIEIRGVEANDFSVSIEGSYIRPDGKVIEIEKYAGKLPANFYVNADCSLDLKITTTGKRFRATVFYEHLDVTKWLATADGIPSVAATFKMKPYEEPK